MTVSEHVLEGVKVYLPVRQYEVTIKHRLLEQLGGFSLLILEALHDFAQRGYEVVYSITGLNGAQLGPIICRLEGLGLIREGGITSKGKELVAIYNHLHRQSRLVWLDGRYKSQDIGPSYYGDRSLRVVPIDFDQAFVLKSWRGGIWPKADWNEDRALQLKRLLEQPRAYFPALFEGFDTCMIGSEARMNIPDWEVEVRVIPETAKTAFAVEAVIDPTSLLSGMNSNIHTHFNFCSPVIGLRTTYNMPQDAPLSMQLNKPKEKFNVLGLLNPVTDETSISPEASSDWTWPDLGGVLYERVVQGLFHNFREDVTSNAPFFNREHQVEIWWQPMSFSWDSVDTALCAIGLKRVNKSMLGK